MRAYISVSYSNRKNIKNVLNVITEVLQDTGIIPFVFIDAYSFSTSEEKQMMAKAMLDIDSSDLLIAEVSDKAIGIGVEAGYAKAKGKPIIYLRHTDAEHSTTLAGISDYQIIYQSVEDLRINLGMMLRQITGKQKPPL